MMGSQGPLGTLNLAGSASDSDQTLAPSLRGLTQGPRPERAFAAVIAGHFDARSMNTILALPSQSSRPE